MLMRVLIAFASRHGSTAEIAGEIGFVLSHGGFEVDVLPVEQVEELSTYDAVVVGSAVYVGRWRPEAINFLDRFVEELVDRPVWLFSSGPTGEGDPVELLEGWQFPTGQQATADRILPRDTVVFHGAIFPERLNFVERWLLKHVKAPVGDFRDWEAIDFWARTIAEQLIREPILAPAL